MAIASGYETKASPVPADTTSETFLPDSCAKLPKIEKIVIPARNEVNVSIKLMIIASLFKYRNLHFSLLIRLKVKFSIDLSSPVDILTELIVTGKHDDGSETYRQREEALSHSRVPSLIKTIKKCFAVIQHIL